MDIGYKSNNNIESELAEYRDRQRRRYLNSKRGFTNEPTSSGYSNEAEVNLTVNIGNNPRNSYIINYPTSSSSEIHKNPNEINNSYSRDTYELTHKIAGSLDLDREQNQQAESKTCNSTANGPLINPSSNNTAQGSTNSLANKDKTNKTRNSKKSIPNSGSGVVSSLKAWTYSLFTHSSKQNGHSRNNIPPRNVDVPTNTETRTESQNTTIQVESQTSGTLRTNISDEELARRMQIEELNSLESFNITGGDLGIHSYIIGNFQDANFSPNTTVSSSNGTTVNPFQGIPYKFELQSSDDERK